MRVALVNIEGDVGQRVANQLFDVGVLGDEDRLLVVNCDPDSFTMPNSCENFEVVNVAEDGVLEADLVLVCPNPSENIPGFYIPDLVRLGDLLDRSAETCTGAVLVAAAPVELAVDVLSEFVDSERVVGLGAYLDAWFWRNELAALLGVDRKRVRALVGGMQGWGSVPLLSSVRVLGLSEVALAHRMTSVGLVPDDEQFFAHWLRARKQIRCFMDIDQPHAALQRLDACSPGVAACLRPLVAEKKSNDVATALIDLMRGLINGEHVMMGVQNRKPWSQIAMDDALPLGRPCFVGREGVIDSVELELSDLECAALRSSLVRLRRLSEDWFVGEAENEVCVCE